MFSFRDAINCARFSSFNPSYLPPELAESLVLHLGVFNCEVVILIFLCFVAVSCLHLSCYYFPPLVCISEFANHLSPGA